MKTIAIATLITTAVLVSGAAAAELRGKDAFGNWQSDAPGTIRLIRPEDLPRPGASPSVANVSRVVPRPDNAMPKVPEGFKIALFAQGLSGPRILRTAPIGAIFVAETRANPFRVLRPSEAGSKVVT